MRFDSTDASFIDKARLWIASVNDSVLADPGTVLDASPGYYPTTLMDLWQQEVQRRGLCPVATGGKPSGSSGDLPVCHPDDYEWRFSEATIRKLLDLAAGSIAHGQTIVHVGAPTTFVLGVRDYHQYRHILLDRNIPIINALTSQKGMEGHIIRVDIGHEPVQGLDAAVAIVDPPWYLSDTLAFLSATSNVCRVGASILLCQPTDATRPGVSEERQRLLGELQYLGLEHRDTLAAGVRYRTPHFEAMSLATSLRDVVVPDDWRKGDLLLLDKIMSASREILSSQPGRAWQEVSFGPVRIKLCASGGDDLQSLVPTDRLDTVSRRDPVREQVGFWTSGNRVFGLTNPGPIIDFIRRCHIDLKAGTFSHARATSYARELAMDDEVASKLFDVLLVELQEHLLRRETYQ